MDCLHEIGLQLEKNGHFFILICCVLSLTETNEYYSQEKRDSNGLVRP